MKSLLNLAPSPSPSAFLTPCVLSILYSMSPCWNLPPPTLSLVAPSLLHLQLLLTELRSLWCQELSTLASTSAPSSGNSSTWYSGLVMKGLKKNSHGSQLMILNTPLRLLRIITPLIRASPDLIHSMKNFASELARLESSFLSFPFSSV